MSDAMQQVRALRNEIVTAHTHMREEVRGSERVQNPIAAVEGDLAAHVTPLTARQMTAINLLAMGKTVVATARTLGIGESTLHRWKATHPLFKLELARRHHDLFDQMVGKLRLTMGKAVDELFSMMTSERSDHRREVMWAMLKWLRPQRLMEPEAPIDLEALVDAQIRAQRAERGDVVEAPISEEERVAAIPAEFRAPHMGNAEAQQTARSESPDGHASKRATATPRPGDECAAAADDAERWRDAERADVKHCEQGIDHRHAERASSVKARATTNQPPLRTASPHAPHAASPARGEELTPAGRQSVQRDMDTEHRPSRTTTRPHDHIGDDASRSETTTSRPEPSIDAGSKRSDASA